jgi:hypothetical protein
VQFIDEDGNIIVPKSVRSIIDLEETILGNKKGAQKQYRYGNLHIREYYNHYAIHTDKINPHKDPIGHLVADAPEYIAGAIAAVAIGKKVRDTIYKSHKIQANCNKVAAFDAMIRGCIAGAIASKVVYDATNHLKKRSKQGQ